MEYRLGRNLSLATGIVCFLLGLYANLAQASIFRFLIGIFYGTELHLGLFLSIWLSGISFGGLLGAKLKISLKSILFALLFLPGFTVLSLFYGVNILPTLSGALLSITPVIIFMFMAVFPVSLVIGMLLPNLVSNSKQRLGYFYSIEATGSFVGGIFFSFLLGGNPNPIITILSLSVLPLVALTLVSRKAKTILVLFTLSTSIFVSYVGPQISNAIEKKFWKKFHPSIELQNTVETPYQKLQLGKYFGQSSLFSNGTFIGSWPLAESSEKLVHSFVTALKDYQEILVVGAPTVDVVGEFLKYPNLKLHIVELDQAVSKMMSYPASISHRINLINDDPRSFFEKTAQKFDGIFITSISPVTLVGNRLFTFESFVLMRNCLSENGVLSFQVSGSENYLGSIKAKIILGTNKALGKIFKDVYAFPGHPITFFASKNHNIIPRKIHEYMKRFAKRKIRAMTFFPQSFFNILMPFRCKELSQWLNASNTIELNTDAHPRAFSQQLELWNIYSGSSMNRYLRYLEKLTMSNALIIMFVLFVIIFITQRSLQPDKSGRMVITFGVMLSGGAGILSEIILILLYQNHHGAAFQMYAFFFGVYMLGLALGAQLKIVENNSKNIRLLKMLQALLVLFCYFFVNYTQYHSAIFISLTIFLISFLDGVEFPLADNLLKKLGDSPAKSAGVLLFMDNFGALIAGLTSGVILLPLIGMKNCFLMLFCLLLINCVFLFLQKQKDAV